MAANRATATAGYYIIIPIIIIVITELFLSGLGAMKVHTKSLSANYTTPDKCGHTLILRQVSRPQHYDILKESLFISSILKKTRGKRKRTVPQ